MYNATSDSLPQTIRSAVHNPDHSSKPNKVMFTTDRFQPTFATLYRMHSQYQVWCFRYPAAIRANIGTRNLPTSWVNCPLLLTYFSQSCIASSACEGVPPLIFQSHRSNARRDNVSASRLRSHPLLTDFNLTAKAHSACAESTISHASVTPLECEAW
jgi:hypothetical protein